jgi:protein MpaA
MFSCKEGWFLIMTGFAAIVVLSYRKILWQYASTLFVLLCFSLQASAQSPLPAPPTRETRQASISQTDSTKFIVPKYLQLGKSVRGRDITAMIYGSGAKHVLVFGGIHGDEPHTTVLARALAVHINLETLPRNLTLIIVPDVNPDGLMAHMRVNANGVDINRNFPSRTWRSEYTEMTRYPGAKPSSEPETRAVLNLLERYPPHLVITLHAALGCVNWDGPGSAQPAQTLASINGYPLCASLGYETPGSLGILAGIDRQVPSVTIELRAKSPSALVEENLPALLSLLKYFAAK